MKKTRKIVSKTGGAPTSPSSRTLKKNSTLTSKAISLGAKIGEKLAGKSIDAIAKYLDIDPNRTASDVVHELTTKLGSVRDALDTPEGREIMEDIEDIGEQVVEKLEGPIKTAQKIGNEFISSEIESLEKTGLDAVGMLPVVGEVVEGVRTGSDVVRAMEEAVDTGAKLTGVGAETLKSLDEELTKSKEIFGNVKNLAKKKADELGELIEKEPWQQMENNTQETVRQQQGGRREEIKEVKKKYRIILKRVTRSKNNFLGGKNNSRIKTKKTLKY
jgi:hypothetical protein